ncbi:hypothetical protein pb186bvf_008362 [Paramecium bursaria]
MDKEKKYSLRLSTDVKENEFFEDDAISKSTIQGANNSFDKRNLDDDVERPFTPSETQSILEEERKIQIEKEQCPNCRRTFFKGRLAPHLRSCTAEKPLLKKKALSQKKSDIICQHCQKKITGKHRCPQRPQMQLKALDKYAKYVVGSCINEEEEQEETILQKELSNSQPSFLPKIKNNQNILSRSVPIVRCPKCLVTMEQRVGMKHIPLCQRQTGSEKKQRDGHLFCTNCGSKFASVHKYCGICGKKRQ